MQRLGKGEAVIRPIYAQFAAPYRGRIEVYDSIKPGDTAETVARRLYDIAVERFSARFTFPSYDRKLMICAGLTDGNRTVNAKDVPS